MHAATENRSKVLCTDMEWSPRYIVYEKKKLQNVVESMTSFMFLNIYTHAHTHMHVLCAWMSTCMYDTGMTLDIIPDS